MENMISEALDALREEAQTMTYTVECPKCHREIEVTEGENICPFCREKIDLTVDVNF